MLGCIEYVYQAINCLQLKLTYLSVPMSIPIA